MSTTEASPSRTLGDAPRADDGYYGPGSVSWRVFADPGAAIGGQAAVFLQALDPGLMTHFSRVSLTNEGPEEMAARFQRTTAYLRDSVFADRAHADAAAAHVDRLHERATWTDPETGEVHVAKVDSWQQWTWWTYVWGSARGYQEYGPAPLTPAELDKFVVESWIGAKALKVPGPFYETFAELDAYINEQIDSKALTIHAARAAHALRHPEVKGGLQRWGARKLINGMARLLPPAARLMYGLEDRSERELANGGRWTKRFVKLSRKNLSVEELIANAIGEGEKHPYRKVRAKVAAAAAS